MHPPHRNNLINLAGRSQPGGRRTHHARLPLPRPRPPGLEPKGNALQYQQALQQIQAAIQADANLTQIEHLIDRLTLIAEERSSLWLYAQAKLEHRQPRKATRA